MPTLRKGRNQYSFILVYAVKWLPTCMVFCLGLSLGHYYGTFSEEFGDNLLSNLPRREDRVISPIVSGDGWKIINVFYGSTDHAVSILPKDQKWFSQARQDEVVLSLLGNKRNGYFVDLAANDATLLSNTYALERHFGWKGLCIEPNPMYWYNLTQYRLDCELVAAVVGHKRMEQVNFLFDAGDHGGILGEEFDNKRMNRRNKLNHQYTVTLEEIFDRYRVPKEIDYLSLDVEGAEEFIMRSFPLQNYKVKLMTVERPHEKLVELLKSHGFEQIQRLSRWGETLWTHKDVKPELDMSNLDEFSGKNQYLAQKALKEKEEKADEEK